jgi:hypothetical protein
MRSRFSSKMTGSDSFATSEPCREAETGGNRKRLCGTGFSASKKIPNRDDAKFPRSPGTGNFQVQDDEATSFGRLN